jgi:hypothetical protein
VSTRGYYLTDPDDTITFPKIERWESEDAFIDEVDVIVETTTGNIWADKLYARREWELIFYVEHGSDDTQGLEFFRTLHQTVQGQVIPFYFVADVDDPDSAVWKVRKEQNFEPRQIEPKVEGDTVTTRFEYRLKLRMSPDRMNLFPLIVDSVSYPEQTDALETALASATTITDSTTLIDLTPRTTFLGGTLLNGTPLNVLRGRGWIPGQIQALKDAEITPYLTEGSADWFEFYGL